MKPPRPYENGNALFLILIAVALFAALSYAVTQSGRGSGDVDKERAVIDAAQITQYAAHVHSTVQRMVLTGANSAELLFGSMDTGSNAVFAPEGGGAVFQVPQTGWCVSPCGAGPFSGWGYDAATSPGGYIPWPVAGIGSSTAETNMWLGPLRIDICEAIDTGLGLGVPPATDNSFVGTEYDAYNGQAFFCYQELGGGGGFWYMHVLVER